MKRFKFQPSILQIIYLIIYVLLFSIIVLIPTLINGPVHITRKLILEEELIEGSLLGLLFIINIFLMYLYKKEGLHQSELINKIRNDKKTTEERLLDAFKYIGQINVQIQEIKTIFNNSATFPETINDFRKTLIFYAEQTFGIVNYNWVLFRIIDCKSHKTLSEHFQSRLGHSHRCPRVSNRIIIEQYSCSPYTTVISNPQNLNILTLCLLPEGDLTNDEKVFLRAITNEITMMFVLLESSYNRNGQKSLSSEGSGKNQPVSI